MTDAAARLTQVLQLLEQQLDTDLNLDSLVRRSWFVEVSFSSLVLALFWRTCDDLT